MALGGANAKQSAEQRRARRAQRCQGVSHGHWVDSGLSGMEQLARFPPPPSFPSWAAHPSWRPDPSARFPMQALHQPQHVNLT